MEAYTEEEAEEEEEEEDGYLSSFAFVAWLSSQLSACMSVYL